MKIKTYLPRGDPARKMAVKVQKEKNENEPSTVANRNGKFFRIITKNWKISIKT